MATYDFSGVEVVIYARPVSNDRPVPFSDLTFTSFDILWKYE